MNTETYSQDDVSLIQQLLADGVDSNTLVEKFDTNSYDFAMRFLDIDYKVTRRLFDLRLSRGTFVLGEDSVEKKCTKCGDHHPFTKEFWYTHKHSQDGAWHICVACEKERARSKRGAKKKNNKVLQQSEVLNGIN